MLRWKQTLSYHTESDGKMYDMDTNVVTYVNT